MCGNLRKVGRDFVSYHRQKSGNICIGGTEKVPCELITHGFGFLVEDGLEV